MGHDFADLARGLAGFTGTRRRMERKGEAGGVRVYDSYAHHPVEIAGDLQAARALAGAAFAWAALRLGGLEFAIGAHVATNLMLALIQGPMLPEDPGVAGDVDDILGEVGLALYMIWAVEITRRMPRLMGSISSPA